MATDVTLPALGESVTEGTVTQWLKSVGDEVAVDESLLEVSTDKVDTEIPSPVAGTLLEIKVDEDETVEVGAVLAVIGDSDESSGDGESSDQGTSGADDQGESDQADSDQSDESEESAESDQADDSDESQESDQSDESQDSGQSEEADESDDGGGDDAKSDQQDAPRADAEKSGDATDVKLPALGESVTEGTVTQWLKSVGDEVAVDEPLLEVSTDKVDTEIPSPVAGTLTEILVDADETVEVGAVLARIGSGDASGGGDSGDRESSEPTATESEDETDEEDKDKDKDKAEDKGEDKEPSQPKQAEQAEEPAEPAAQKKPEAAAKPSEDAKSYVTPLVRKLASQHGVDLGALTGTGVGGRIRKQDVLEAAEKAKQQKEAPAAAASAPAAAPTKIEPSPLRGKTEKLSRLRKVIASRMVESLQVSAQLTTVVEVDVTAISRLRDKAKADFATREGVKLSFLPFFAKAAIDALKVYPQVNASIDTEAGEVTYHAAEHLGVAVDTERGLLVPVIKDAGDLSIAGLARKIGDLAGRTRDNKIGPDELSGGTFTLTNTGSRGALFDTPIINQPQVAILGTGTVVKRPVVLSDPNIGETIAVRQMVYLALTYDHRLVDGADAARFLTAIKQRLEEANFEAELGL